LLLKLVLIVSASLHFVLAKILENGEKWKLQFYCIYLVMAYLCYSSVCYKNLGKPGRQLLQETPFCFRYFKRCKQNGVPEF